MDGFWSWTRAVQRGQLMFFSAFNVNLGSPDFQKCTSNHSSQYGSHCTMQQLKNWVQSGQLWQLISPKIFTQNPQNFSQSCLKTQKIKTDNQGEKKQKK